MEIDDETGNSAPMVTPAKQSNTGNEPIPMEVDTPTDQTVITFGEVFGRDMGDESVQNCTRNKNRHATDAAPPRRSILTPLLSPQDPLSSMTIIVKRRVDEPRLPPSKNY